uniref:Uncharacterized protein n=1 Tax=Amphora coffeiformis TaxID=265554 RepID=A0A7S3L3I1_9STRA
MESMARQIMEQAILEQELQAIMEARNYGLAGSSLLPQQQQTFSPYMQQNRAPLQYLSQQQQQQVQQLAELERLMQLQQMQQQPASPPLLQQQQQRQNFAAQQQQQQRQLNEEIILAQAIEQARIAQFLQAFQS